MSWTIKSFEKYRLMAPGPVALHPEVLCALSAPMVHHRTPLFDQILKSALAKLRLVFQTQEPVFILSGTGSTGMEAALINVLSSGDEVLCIVSGKFGERWREMSVTFGYQVHSLDIPWGQAVNPIQVQQALVKHPQIKAVLCQVCETSTAVLHPIKELAQTIKKQNPQILFLVDAITAAGTLNLPMDEWQLDAVVAGSQKAFMLPTGLSFVAFSKLAQSHFVKAKTPRYALDIRLEKKANEKGETYFSSSVTLIRALDKALDVMLKNGLSNWFSQIQKKAEWTRHLGQQLKLQIYSQSPSPSLTALKVPDGIDGQKLREHMESHYNLTVMGGQDSLKGKILRIGHMGHIEKDDLLAFAGALYLSLKDLNYKELPSENQFYSDCETSLKDF
jgi:aspartate aminotransferase-like enzyme